LIAVWSAFGGAYLELAEKLGVDALFRRPFVPDTILNAVRRMTKR
jgi:hypothetical protein